jgi:hypothetical protein
MPARSTKLPALHAHQKAADIDSNDWRPLWNTLTVHCEIGNYNKVIATISTILYGTQQMKEPDC